MPTHIQPSNAESFDQLLWELQVLDENWAMRNPLRLLVYNRHRPDKESTKQYASYGLLIFNVISWLFVAVIVEDPRAGLALAYVSLLSVGIYYFTVRAMRRNELTFLHQREELISRIKTALAKVSSEYRDESIRNLWLIEEQHLLRNRLFLLMPWEQQIGSGRYLTIFSGIATIALMTLKPWFALFLLILVICGLARWLTWRELKHRKQIFLDSFTQVSSAT